MNALLVGKRRDKIEALVLLFPFLLWFGVFVLYPLINCVFLSFKENYNLLTQGYTGYGLENYADILGDEYFQQALKNTFTYTALCVPIAIILSLLIAGFLCSNIRLKSIFQATIFLPMVTSVSAVGYSWRLMFNDTYGVVNYISTVFGFEKIRWLSNPRYSMPLLVTYGVWSMLPITVLLLVNAINSVPKRLYLAAQVDEASAVQQFYFVTVPNILPTVGILLFTNAMSSVKVFDELYPLFSGKPGPAYNMYTLVYYIYTSMQGPYVYGYGKAAAAAVILLSIILLLVILFLSARSIGRRQ